MCNLMAEINFLRQSPCSILLHPLAKPGSSDQTRPRDVDAVRDEGADMITAEAEVNGHIIQI